MAPRASNTEPSAWPAPAAIGFLAAIVLVAAQDCEDLRPVTIAPPQPSAVATGETGAADAGADGGEGEGDNPYWNSPEFKALGQAERDAIEALRHPPRRKLVRLQSPRVPRKGWPVTCSYRVCVTADNEPGYRCEGESECFNPCPVGMAPGDVVRLSGWCVRFCNEDADCPDGNCQYGLCGRSPAPEEWGEAQARDFCKTKDGRWGETVKGDTRCIPICKRGMVLYGGDTCAKPCSRNADCPGGTCTLDEQTHICAPICPSEGCPYPWE